MTVPQEGNDGPRAELEGGRRRWRRAHLYQKRAAHSPWKPIFIMPKQAEKPTGRLERRNGATGAARSGGGSSAAPLAASPSKEKRPAARVRSRSLGIALAGVCLLSLAAGGGVILWRAAGRHARRAALQAQEDPTRVRLQRAVAARPNDAAARRELGIYEADHARPFEATWELAEAQHLHPADPAVSLHLASALQTGRSMGAAAAQLVTMLRVRPDDLEIRRRLAELYLGTAEPQRARGLMEERRAAVWQDAEATIVLGRALQASGDDAGAAAAYQRSLSLQPQQDEAWFRLGRLFLVQGRLDEARNAFFHTLVVNRAYPECAFYTGMLFLRQNHPGDMDRAISFFKDALAVRPSDARAHYEYGVALARKGQRDLALTRDSLAILSDMTYAPPNLSLGLGMAAAGNARDSHRYLARYYDLLDRPAEAAREFEAMAKAAPKSVSPALLESQIDTRTQQDARAVAVVEAALKHHPDDVQLLERLAALKIQRGDRAYARRLLHHWLTLYPRASRPCWLLGRCDFGDLKYPEGIVWEEKALRSQPHNPDYLAFLAGGLLKLDTPGSLERAAQALSEAVTRSPNNVEYHDLYAQALQRLGRYEEARKQCLQALDLDPFRMSCYAPLVQLAWRLHRPGPAAFYPPLIRALQQRLNEEGLLWSRAWQHPEDADAHLKLARFLCRTADLTKARYQLEQALALRPYWPEAQGLLTTVRRVQETE